MKKLLLFVVFLTVAVPAHSQFNAILINSTPLRYGCRADDNPAGAGDFATIYWDQNNNGPDFADFPARIDGPEYGRANFNQIDLGTGNDLLGIPGGFATEPAFTISTNTPTPSRYYVRAQFSHIVWTSVTFTILDGLNDYDLSSGWQCENVGIVCNEPTLIQIETVGGRNFVANGPYYQCLHFCASVPTTICFGPLAADERPNVMLLPGCQHDLMGCDVPCPTAELIYDPAGWVYVQATSSWCNTVLAGYDGCACLCLDFIESTIGLDITVRAGDSEVEVLWSTESETNMASYNIQRRIVGHAFETIGSVAAANNSTTTSYTFVDESADNGTAYEYTLQLVDINGGTTMSETIASATPSSAAAVITEYALHQNYPNPFNPSTTITFDVVEANKVTLNIFNVNGQIVATPVSGAYSSGRHTVSFDAANLTSGLYFYTVKIGNEFTATKKMLLIK